MAKSNATSVSIHEMAQCVLLIELPIPNLQLFWHEINGNSNMFRGKMAIAMVSTLWALGWNKWNDLLFPGRKDKKYVSYKTFWRIAFMWLPTKHLLNGKNPEVHRLSVRGARKWKHMAKNGKTVLLSWHHQGLTRRDYVSTSNLQGNDFDLCVH